jgi:hypothetical protein
VFVIETKDYKGWIFGDARQAKWTQVLFKYKFRFQNPIVQNLGHVRDGARPSSTSYHPTLSSRLVVFTGEARVQDGDS